MSPIEYDTLMSKLMDIILEKSYSGELEWASTINSDGAIKYETILFLHGVTITCILICNVPMINSIDIYIKLDDMFIKIDWNVCGLINNSEVETKAYELKCVLESRSSKFVLNKLKNLII